MYAHAEYKGILCSREKGCRKQYFIRIYDAKTEDDADLYFQYRKNYNKFAFVATELDANHTDEIELELGHGEFPVEAYSAIDDCLRGMQYRVIHFERHGKCRAVTLK